MYTISCAQIAEPSKEKQRAALIEAVQVKKLTPKSRQSILEMIWQMRPK